MKNNKKITYGMIGILSLIVATLGGTIYLTPDQLDHAYICSINQNVVIADYLSSTSKTAYWTEENVTKSKVCRGGYWLNLKQYAKDNQLDINILLENLNKEETIQDTNTIKYRCNQVECIKVVE